MNGGQVRVDDDHASSSCSEAYITNVKPLGETEMLIN